MVVQHNLTAMNANRMLGITTSSQAKSTEKLSSGYKINRAADDAAGLSISEKMRKQIRGLTQASSNAQDGISAVQTAEGALNEVQDMLQRMNELAVKAANGTNSEDDRSYIQDEIDQLVSEIDRVAETTKFNETYLLKGDDQETGSIDFKYSAAAVLAEDVTYKSGNSFVTVAAGSYVSNLPTENVTYFSVGTAAKSIGTAATTTDVFTTSTVIAATDYYVKSGEDYVMVAVGATFDSAETYYQLEFATDGSFGTATAVTTASTADGYFVGSTTIYDATGTLLDTGTALGTTVDVGKYYTEKGLGLYDPGDGMTYAQLKTTQNVVQLTDKDGNEIAENGLYAYFDEDGSYQGSGLYLNGKNATAEDVSLLVNTANRFEVGALELKLHVGADATSNNQISLKIESMSAEVLGVSDVRVDGTDDTNALNAIETIKAAIQKVSTQRSALGAVQNRLEHTINNLDNVVENTTSAESQIRDTDMATEMVNYSNNNILAQAGQAMLAQANQANQGVLSLLG